MVYTSRISHLHTILKKNTVDAALISSVPHIIYLTGYSGFSLIEREAFLLITKRNNYIFTDARYSEAVVPQIPHFVLNEITSSTPFNELMKKIITEEKLTSIGFESNNLTVSEYKRISSLFAKKKALPLHSIRLIKNTEEIQGILKACRLGDKAFSYILPFLKPGVSEKEICFKLEQYIRQHHAEVSFPSIVAFGKNASIPHHQTGNDKLTKNSSVLLDFGTKVNNYCSDMTRTVYVGSAPAEFKRMYQTVLDAQEKAIEFLNLKSSILNQSIKASEVDKVAREHIISQDYPSIPHSLGHGVGIEVHEPPRLSPVSKDILQVGMVFSVEPGIYIQGKGGIRIEDMVALEKSGPRILTKAPKQLIEL